MEIKVNVKTSDCIRLAERMLTSIGKQREQLISQAIDRKMTEKKLFSKKIRFPTKELAIEALKDSKNYQGWWDNEYEALCNFRKESEGDIKKLLTMLNEHALEHIDIDEDTFYLLGFHYGK